MEGLSLVTACRAFSDSGIFQSLHKETLLDLNELAKKQ